MAAIATSRTWTPAVKFLIALGFRGFRCDTVCHVRRRLWEQQADNRAGYAGKSGFSM